MMLLARRRRISSASRASAIARSRALRARLEDPGAEPRLAAEAKR